MQGYVRPRRGEVSDDEFFVSGYDKHPGLHQDGHTWPHPVNRMASEIEVTVQAAPHTRRCALSKQGAQRREAGSLGRGRTRFDCHGHRWPSLKLEPDKTVAGGAQ